MHGSWFHEKVKRFHSKNEHNMSDYPHNWPRNSVPIKWITVGWNALISNNGEENSVSSQMNSLFEQKFSAFAHLVFSKRTLPFVEYTLKKVGAREIIFLTNNEHSLFLGSFLRSEQFWNSSYLMHHLRTHRKTWLNEALEISWFRARIRVIFNERANVFLFTWNSLISCNVTRSER